MKGQKNLSRRERQIMDVIYELQEATVNQVLERLSRPPSYSAGRALLRVLEQKGHLAHRQDGPRYIYAPTWPKERARRSALKHLLQTFFDGSTEDAVAALLDISEESLSAEDYRRLLALFRKRTASLRHFVLSLSLAGLLLLPVLPYFGGGWETSLLPAGAREPFIFLTAPAAAKADDYWQGRQGSRGFVLSPSPSLLAPKIIGPHKH